MTATPTSTADKARVLARAAVEPAEPTRPRANAASGAKAADATARPIRVGFVLHVMQVAGAEVLVAETIRRLGPAIEPVVFCLDGVGALGEVMQREGVDVLPLGRRPGLDLGVAWRLSRLLRERRIEVLHAHQYTPFFYGAIAVKLAGIGTRTVLTEHGRHFPDVVSGRRRLVNRLVFSRWADRLTAVCAFSADGLSRQDGFPAARIEIIENGIEVDRYAVPSDRAALRTRLGLPADRRYIVSVARFHPVKDHRTLLRAFARVAGERNDVDLLLAGDGPLRLELEALASELSLAGRVRFLGVRSDVSDLLAASDLFALASISEAASITLLEAMATGLPVVVTNVGGNPEIVRDGVDGVLTPRGDAAAMAAAIGRVFADGDAAGTMGAHARARVREIYTIDRTMARYGRMYCELAWPSGR